MQTSNRILKENGDVIHHLGVLDIRRKMGRIYTVNKPRGYAFLPATRAHLLPTSMPSTPCTPLVGLLSLGVGRRTLEELREDAPQLL